MSTHLLITLGGNLISALLMTSSGLFVLWKNPRRPLNIFFFCLTLSVTVFCIDFIAAPLMPNLQAAYTAWMFNVLDVFITMSVVTFIVEVIEKRRELRWFLACTYVLGFLILGVAVAFPHLFLPRVEPRLYFPTYLVGGPWYAVMLAYFLGMPLLAFFALVRSFFMARDIERSRYGYFILMMIVGYGLGCLDFPLVFNIPLDPLYGMFIGLYIVPLAYGVVSDQLFDIPVFIERAVIYVVGVALSAAALIALVVLDNLLLQRLPGIGVWTLPLVVALAAFLIGRMAWRQFREADRLKYEFVTIMAHKLRVPLTRIRWETSELLKTVADPKVKEYFERIQQANDQLVDLVGLLVKSTQTGGDRRNAVEVVSVDLAEITRGLLQGFKEEIARKRLDARVEIPEELRRVMGDLVRIRSVVDVMLDNAITYTPEGGSVTATAKRQGDSTVYMMRDTGIGVAPADRAHVFTPFFRTAPARHVDTEGSGLLLSMARGIIRSMGGSMGVLSEGEGKGSTFWFSLPTALS